MKKKGTSKVLESIRKMPEEKIMELAEYYVPVEPLVSICGATCVCF